MRKRSLLLIAFAVVIGAFVCEPILTGVGPADHGKFKYNHKRPPKKRPKPAKPKNMYIQIDPMRILYNFSNKDMKVGPNIIIAMDNSMRMQYDFDGWYYDELIWDANASYKSSDGEQNPRTVATGLGVPASARYYRRKFLNLRRTANSSGATTRFDADTISVVPETSADWADFYSPSRLGMARDGLYQSISENMYVINYGLVRSRFGDGDKPKVPDKPGNQSPVYVSDAALASKTADYSGSRWRTTWVFPGDSNNIAQTNDDKSLLVKVLEDDGASSKTALFMMNPVDASAQDQTLVPGGRDTATFQDAPLTALLTDTRAAVVRAMDHDKDECRGCRNTAVILVVGGKEGGSSDPVAVARTFTAVSNKGVTKPVPIYVIAVGVDEDDTATRTQLQAIADESGGEYFDAWGPTDVAWAASFVAQSVFRRRAEFDAGLDSEFQTTSPIVGTVNLTGANDINGAPLADAGGSVSQGANTVITTGFSLPGFETRIRAFRTYKAQADATKPYGYKFVKDGTPLWAADVPAAAQRNIYTYIPGVGTIPFTQANAATLKPYLGMTDDAWVAEVIDYVRIQPLTANITSTPALVGPPSMTPVPDADYTAFATARRGRRALVFYGGNDGMIHALDARLGVEVWAFIPFNMLPKLPTLLDGQPIDHFDYFMDASPKVSDVKVGGTWRTYMMIGDGAGGTFYQTFDISNICAGVSATDNSIANVLAAFTSPASIPFVWSYPSYSSFDHTISTDYSEFGDIKSSATALEKSVGQTWSTPVIAQVGDMTSPYVAVAGSGYITPPMQAQSNRGNVMAGTTLYVLDMATGLPYASYNVGDDTNKDTLKNSLTADPSTTGPSDSRFIDRIYIGDSEGDMWRFRITKSGSNITLSTPIKLYDATKYNPIFTSAALLSNGDTQEYVFFATGMDILPWTGTDKINQFSLVGVLDSGGSGTAQKLYEIFLDKADAKGGDERPSSNPTVAGGITFFTTTTEYPKTPCRSYESSLFALTLSGGPAYDLTKDDTVNSNDLPLQRATGRATAVYVADKHLYFGTDQGLEVFGEPEGFNNSIARSMFRAFAWREKR